MEVREGGAGVGVVGVRAEVGVRMQTGVGAEEEVSVEATERRRRPALDMYPAAHRALFHDHLFVHAVAVYRRIVWTRNLQVDEWRDIIIH